MNCSLRILGLNMVMSWPSMLYSKIFDDSKVIGKWFSFLRSFPGILIVRSVAGLHVVGKYPVWKHPFTSRRMDFFGRIFKAMLVNKSSSGALRFGSLLNSMFCREPGNMKKVFDRGHLLLLGC